MDELGLSPEAQRFRTYISWAAEDALAQVSEGGAGSSSELRDHARHILSYALSVPDAWLPTRDLLLQLAPVMEQAGHRDDWVAYLKQGVFLGESLGDHLAVGELHFQIAVLYRMVSQFELTDQHLSMSLAHFSSLNHRQGQGRVQNELAWIDYLRHRYPEAIQHAQQALALLGAREVESGMSYRVLGMVAIEEGEYVKSAALHQQALTIFANHHDQRRVAWSLQNLANALRGQRQFDAAILHYQQALESMSALGDMHSAAVVEFNLGITYQRWGKYESALIHYHRAIAVFSKLQNRLYLARLYTDLGLTYFSIDHYQEAASAFQTSSQLFAELEQEFWQLNALDGLAMTYLAQQQFANALPLLESAIANLPLVVDDPNYANLSRSLQEHLLEAQMGVKQTR
jgi:tetratricopeptide (TPR) repeat protein